MSFIRTLLSAVVVLISHRFCHASPSGAATCGSGASITGRGAHGTMKRGDIDSDSDFELSFNDEVLQTSSTTTITQAKSNIIKLKNIGGDEDDFKGFLFRLQKDGSVNTGSTTLSVSPLDGTQRKIYGCNSNVLAMTHDSIALKKELVFSVGFDDDSEYTLDVTVVRQATNWYHSSFNFVSPPAPSTDSPTRSPIDSSSTYSPTIVDIEKPSSSPTAESDASKSGFGLISFGVTVSLGVSMLLFV